MHSDGGGQEQAPGFDLAGSSTTGQDPPWVDEVLDDVRSPFTATAVATAYDAARLRHELTAWLAVDVPHDPLDDLVLAAYEAIANAAEHAYPDHGDGARPIHLHARRAHDRVLVVITDEGTWRTPTGERFRSRGLAVMHLLVHDVHISRRPTGTVVHLRMWLAPDDTTQPV
jgi:anti-sigma regulatory factor (Ser/Thr protein kinase)